LQYPVRRKMPPPEGSGRPTSRQRARTRPENGTETDTENKGKGGPLGRLPRRSDQSKGPSGPD